MQKTALITGASEGIGHAFAHVFAQNGYDVALVARQSQKLQDLKKKLEQAYPVAVHTMACDLSAPGAAQVVYDGFSKKFPIEILVNNAGAGLWGPFLETSWEKEAAMVQLNVLCGVHLTKLFLPHMVKRNSGGILNVASTVAFVPGPLNSIYYASKAFMLSFSQALARELKGTSVRVTALCPGPTKTGFLINAGRKKPSEQNLPSAQSVAEFGYQALCKGKTVAVHGFKNKSMVALSRVAPKELIADLIYNFQK